MLEVPLKIKPNAKILIVLFGAIGDVARGLSVPTKIKEHFPETEIHWAIEKTSSTLLENYPSIDHVHVFNRKKGFIEYLSFLRKIRSLNCDITLDFSRHLKGGLCSYFSNSSLRIGFSKANSRELNWLFQTNHIEEVPHFSDKIKQFQKFTELLGVPKNEKVSFDFSTIEKEISDFENKLEQIAKEQNIPTPPLSRRVLFLIASTWESREWPSSYFAELARDLNNEFDITPILIGAPSDISKGEEILDVYSSAYSKDSSGKPPILNLIGKTSLREFIILSSRSFCGIGSDSGPMHIASIVGLPVISFWGSTSPKRSTPFGNENGILQSPIGCSPCYFRKCPGLNTLCLKNITPKIVKYKFESFYSSYMSTDEEDKKD